MAQDYWYGDILPVYFKLTKDGAAVIGAVFAAGDVMIGIDGATGIDISADCAETDFGYGWYKWTPSSTVHTSGITVLWNVADLTVTPLFDDNAGQLITGGNKNAYKNAGQTRD